MTTIRATSKKEMLESIDAYVPRRYQGKTLRKIRSLVSQSRASDSFTLRDDDHNLTLTLNFPT